MKKTQVKSYFFKKMPFLAILAFATSCQEDALVNTTENFDLAQKTSSSMFSEVSAIKIDNGLPNPENKNNILIFPTLEKYQEIVQNLDTLVDQHNDAFEASADPNLTDEEYEELALQNRFDEDQPLIDFEASLNFTSLRKKILEEELDWLSRQSDGEWNAEEDPDNHHIFNDTERALLNTGVEFIVGTNEQDYRIYKFVDDNLLFVIDNFDLELLRAVNVNPYNFTDYSHPNLQVIDPCFFTLEGCGGSGGTGTGGGSSSTGCKGSNDIRKYFSTGSSTRIKTIGKYTSGSLVGNAKVKAKTKYYRKKLGAWTPGKTTLTARLATTAGISSCGSGIMPPPREQTSKRHKVKTDWKGSDLNGSSPKIIKEKTFSIHKRRTDVVKFIDLFDGQVH